MSHGEADDEEDEGPDDFEEAGTDGFDGAGFLGADDAVVTAERADRTMDSGKETAEGSLEVGWRIPAWSTASMSMSLKSDWSPPGSGGGCMGGGIIVRDAAAEGGTREVRGLVDDDETGGNEIFLLPFMPLLLKNKLPLKEAGLG